MLEEIKCHECHRLVEPSPMEGIGDGVIQPDIMVERDACKPRQRREVAKHGQVKESDGDVHQCECQAC